MIPKLRNVSHHRTGKEKTTEKKTITTGKQEIMRGVKSMLVFTAVVGGGGKTIK